MEPIGNDRWHGAFPVEALGRWQYTITAWIDRWASWRWEIDRKLEGGQKDLSSELLEGAALAGVETLTLEEALDPALAPKLGREGETTALPLELIVDRERARFGSWYELFPRSWGGFAGVEAQLPRLAELGFDVIYLPPIHPIGRTHRKGRNNSLEAGPDDPGSPWAIGGPEGGHTASTRSSARSPTSTGSSQRAQELGHRDRARLRDPVLARPSLARRAPGLVPPPPRRHAQVRREPAQALPGHLQRQLRLRRLAEPLAGAPRRRPLLGRPRRQGLPRRQPAHEAGRLLGVADPRGAGRPTPT